MDRDSEVDQEGSRSEDKVSVPLALGFYYRSASRVAGPGPGGKGHVTPGVVGYTEDETDTGGAPRGTRVRSPSGCRRVP